MRTSVPRLTHPLAALLAARGSLFPWVPVCIALGIGGYFALPEEPGRMAYGAVVVVGLAALCLWRFGGEGGHAPAVALFCLMLGGADAGLRAHMVAAPVLAYRYYGPIEGRIVGIDRSVKDQTRITLDQVVLARMAPARTPAQVRVTLHGLQVMEPEAGMVVILTGHLSPPAGPAEPGGFDFQRMAWFARIGGVGYAQSPMLLWEAPQGGQGVTRMRLGIAAAVRARMPGQAGAFAAAILTGDRSGVDRQTVLNLRGANTSHLLAISGLHMGLLTGFVFAALRYGLALVPYLALRLPVKKIAAVVALFAAAFYLVLSGGNVATQRAFIMVAVMLGAVVFDRRALSLRSVALAATAVLLLQPESLTQPGFQMSFAATTALVASYGAFRGIGGHWLPRWLSPAASLVFSSFIAGAATAPISAATFNRVAEYGLLANFLSIPVMGMVVMPAAVVAGLLTPLGAQAPALWVMGLGTRWILFVADRVAHLPGALIAVPTPPSGVIAVMALGALWIVLWRSGARWLGAVGVAGALAVWMLAERPVLLIADDGTVVGVMTPAGRALSKPNATGFVAASWLENDGDGAPPQSIEARAGFDGQGGGQRFFVGGTGGIVLSGRGAASRVAAACAAVPLVILGEKAEAPKGCLVFDLGLLRRTGAIAAVQTGTGLRFITAAERQGHRLWSPHFAATPRSVPPVQLLATASN